MKIRSLAVGLVALLGFLGTAHAESIHVTGQIFDGSRAAIAGANLSMTQGDAVVAETTSDATGAFALPAVEGAYLLQVSAAGFEPALIEVQVHSDIQPLAVTLEPAAILTSVTVNAERALITLDADNNLSALVLDEDMIEALPDDEEALAAYLTELAGPRAAAAGGVQFTIDGFSGSAIPPKNEIQQIRINNNPYTAEFGRPGFGRIEIITKAGTGKLRGNSTFTFRDDALNASNAFAELKPDFQQKNVQLSISGPVIKDKLSVSLFASRNDQTAGDTIQAETLDGPVNASFVRPSLRQAYGARGQYQTSPGSILNFNFQLGSSTTDNVGAGGFSLLERGSSSEAKQSTLQLRQTGLLSEHWIYESRFEFSKDFTRTTPNSTGVTINVLDAFLAGGAQNRGEEKNLGMVAGQSFIYSAGNITMKTGVEWNFSKLRSLAENNYQGTFVYSSLDAYRAGTPTTFTVTQGNPLIALATSRYAAFLQADLKIGTRLVVSPGVRYQAQTGLADYNNVAPRLSFAYLLNKSTVLRGGTGLFHQELSPSIIATVVRLDGTRQVQLVSSGGVDSVVSPTVRVFAPDLAAPYTLNGSLSLEKTIASTATTLTASYDFIRGIQLYRSRDIDQTPSSVLQLESSGLSTFQGMTIGFRQRFGKAVNLNAHYTYALSYNDTDGAFSLPANSLDLTSEWGRAADDRRHQLFGGLTFKLPRNIALNTMFRMQSARPYNITTGFDDNGDTITNDRPDGLDRNTGKGPAFFDMSFNLSRTIRLSNSPAPAAQERMPEGGRPMPGAGGPGGGPQGGGPQGGGPQGGMPPGGMGAGTSGASLTFFMNVQNVLNHTNYSSYSGVLTSPYFGRANSALHPRELELGIRFNF